MTESEKHVERLEDLALLLKDLGRYVRAEFVFEAITFIHAQQSTIAQQAARIEELEGLLKPMASWAETIPKEFDDDMAKDMFLDVGEIRRAAAALTRTEPEAKG